MSFKVQDDKEVWLKYWNEEKTFPRWFTEANEIRYQDEEDFLKFCEGCSIYELDGCGLLYVEHPKDDAVEIHFSVLRGSKGDFTEDLLEIRDMWLKRVGMIFCWVYRGNRGIKKVCRAAGFDFHDWKGHRKEETLENGRKITWECFSIIREEKYVERKVSMLLSV